MTLEFRRCTYNYVSFIHRYTGVENTDTILGKLYFLGLVLGVCVHCVMVLYLVHKMLIVYI